MYLDEIFICQTFFSRLNVKCMFRSKQISKSVTGERAKNMFERIMDFWIFEILFHNKKTDPHILIYTF